MESTSWQQFNLALCSLNLAEASTNTMERDVLAQIYATAAVTALHTLTEHFNFIPVRVVFSISLLIACRILKGLNFIVFKSLSYNCL